MNTKVLIVDDDSQILGSLKRLIERENYEALIADNGRSALQAIRKENPVIVFLDLKLPDLNGLSVLKKIKDINKDIIVILISAYGTFKDVVSAMQIGAFDYIPKPYNNDEIKICLIKAAKELKMRKDVRCLRYTKNQIAGPSQTIAKSAKMRLLLDVAIDVGKSSDTPVLILGETGVGKEIVANIIHANSPRRDEPFLTLNCGAITSSLFESELFGYEKGAFTNANTNKPGLIELADEGTLLLDEIGELSMEGQVKLLRILENKTYHKVGGTVQKRSNSRIIASTNKKLYEEIDKGTFREDLYYRLNVICLEIPPLRERKEDIIPLAKYFIQKYSIKFNKKTKRITPKAKEHLENHYWRGNVRELKNIIERCFLLNDRDVLTIDSLDLNPHNNKNKDAFIVNLLDDDINFHNINKRLIKKVLQLSSASQTKAARILGLSRGALRYRIKKYQILSDNIC